MTIEIGSRIECVDCAYHNGIHEMGTVIEHASDDEFAIKWDSEFHTHADIGGYGGNFITWVFGEMIYIPS